MGTLLYSRPARSTDDKVGGGRLVRAESLPSGGCANPAWHLIELNCRELNFVGKTIYLVSEA